MIYHRRVGTSITLGLVALITASCVPKGPGVASGTGGSPAGTAGSGGTAGTSGTAGTTGTPGDAGTRASDGGDGPNSDAAPGGGCVETPTPLRASGTTLDMPFDLFLDGKPFVFGEPNTQAAGGTIIPLNFRFYVSEVALLRAGAAPVPVDIVTAAGVPQPYGVHLFNAEDVTSRTLRVLAPPGTYTGISFLLGLNAACNQGGSASRKPPLSDTSQMTWPFPFGYLFLRYEGRFDPSSGQDAGAATGVPLGIHMGGDPRLPLAPAIRLEGTLSVPATGSFSKNIRVLMDQIFKGATTEVDLTGFLLPPIGEAVAGEQLRRNAPGLQLFVFGP